MFSRSNKDDDGSNGSSQPSGSRSTSASTSRFGSLFSTSSQSPPSSRKKEKPLPLRPPESLPPQQYGRYVPSRANPLVDIASAQPSHPAQPASAVNEQARPSTRMPVPNRSEQTGRTLQGLGRPEINVSDAPARTHSRGRSEAYPGRASSPPRRLPRDEQQSNGEAEAQMMREDRAERTRGHRHSSSLDERLPKLTIDPKRQRDSYHIPTFPFQAPTPTTAVSSFNAPPVSVESGPVSTAEPPKEDTTLPPPPMPIPAPAPVAPPPPSSAAWGNLLALSSAQSRPGKQSSTMFGPPAFRPPARCSESPTPSPARPNRSTSPPPPPPPPPNTKRTVSNPANAQPPLLPPAPISQSVLSSSPKWKNLLPRGPNNTANAAEGSTSRPVENGLSSTPPPAPSPWDHLLALSSASGPTTMHGPPVFTTSGLAHPPSQPQSASHTPVATPPAVSSYAPSPWDNLLAMAAANGAVASTPPTTSSALRLPLFNKSTKPKEKEQPPPPSHPPPPLSEPAPPSPTSRGPTRHAARASSSGGPGGLLVPAPNLLSKREDRSGPIAGPSGGIGITGFVRAANGDGPRKKPEMATSPCICCAATLQYPKTVSSFRCTVCGTISDVEISSRRAAGLPKQSDPFPLSISRFRALLDSARSAANAPSSPSASSFCLDDYDDDDVQEARTIEGDSGGEDDRDDDGAGGTGAGAEDAGGLRLEPETERREEWWAPLEAELLAVFSHWSSLSGSFSNGVEPSLTESGVDMIELRAFYDLLAILPGELGQAVVKGLEGLLRRPRRRFDSGMGPNGLSWVLIILENPLLFRNGVNQSQAAGSVIKRFLGLVSNLANDQHHYLVHWFSRQYPPQDFQRRVELINITLAPRIRKHMQASDVPPAMRASKPLPYLHDWKFRSAARTLSLFYAANAMSQLIPVSSFYITLMDNLDVVADYECWIRTASTSSKSAFFLSQYPFLLSLGAKLKVLVHDSKKQQQQAQSSIDPTDGRRLVQPHITIRVHRARLLEDSLDQISRNIHNLKRALRIEFVGEEGVDAGGLKKEWFLLLIRELLDPRYGMWLTDDDSKLAWFNPASLEAAEQYTLIGVVVGLAVYHASTLDIPLPGAAFKRLLNKPVTIDDLAEWQPALARGLRDMLTFQGDVEETYCRTFVGEYESYGEIVSVPLVPGGADIPVTAANREDYVNRLVQFHLVDSVSRQFKAFQRGWLSVCEGNALSLFHAEEIELLVRGSPEAIDVGQLRSVTVLDGFAPNDPLIESLWALIESFTVEEQRKFLAFVTGSDRIPATGIINMPFRIQATTHPLSHLPTTHTCFNVLSLPRYKSRSALTKKLVQALGMSSGFGLK